MILQLAPATKPMRFRMAAAHALLTQLNMKASAILVMLITATIVLLTISVAPVSPPSILIPMEPVSAMIIPMRWLIRSVHALSPPLNSMRPVSAAISLTAILVKKAESVLRVRQVLFEQMMEVHAAAPLPSPL